MKNTAIAKHSGNPIRASRILFAQLAGFAFAIGATQAQAPRSAAPVETTTTRYDVAGITVIHRPSPGDIVVANLYLLGGMRQHTWQNAGTEVVLLEASERGTKSYSRDKLRRTMAKLGTGIGVSPSRDWTMVGLRATRQTLDSTWAVFASRIMEPTLEPSEVELVKQQFLLGVRQRQDSPDALVDYLADSAAFAGHPYAIPVVGTEASLAAITPTSLRDYHAANFVKSRMLLVVVGNVTRERVTRLVMQSLGRLPAGSYRWSLPDTLPRRRASVLVVDRDLPTNYILGRYPGPKAGSTAYEPLRVATAILSGQLFSEVRSKRNLTYAVEAPFLDQAVSSGGFYVTTVAPQQVVDIMRQQLAAVRTATIDGDALPKLVQQFLTQYYLENETNASQANALAKAQLYDGDFHELDSFERKLRAVTPNDIQRAAREWIRDVQWVYIGQASKAPKVAMERF